MSQIITSELMTFLIITVVMIFLYSSFDKKISRAAERLDKENKKGIEKKLFALNHYGSLIVYCLLILNLILDIKIVLTPLVLLVTIVFIFKNELRSNIAGYKRISKKVIAVNDHIVINNEHKGEVINVSLTEITIKKADEQLFIINHLDVHSIEKCQTGYITLENSVVLSHREDPEVVEKIMIELTEKINKKFEVHLNKDEEGDVIDPFLYTGITNLDAEGIEYAIKGKVLAEEYEEFKRKIDREIAICCFKNKLRSAEKNVFFKTRSDGK